MNGLLLSILVVSYSARMCLATDSHNMLRGESISAVQPPQADESQRRATSIAGNIGLRKSGLPEFPEYYCTPLPPMYGDYFHLVSKHSGLSIQVKFSSATGEGEVGQRGRNNWRVEPVGGDDAGLYHIENYHSDYSLHGGSAESADGADPLAQTGDDLKQDIWCFHRVGSNGYYRIVAQNTMNALDEAASSNVVDANGLPILKWSGIRNSQLFRLDIAELASDAFSSRPLRG